MVATHSRYLGQVGDGYHLTLGMAHLTHHLRHLLSNLATDTRIYLVEDDGRQLHRTTNHRLQREHHTGYLTTRRHLTDRL